MTSDYRRVGPALDVEDAENAEDAVNTEGSEREARGRPATGIRSQLNRPFPELSRPSRARGTADSAPQLTCKPGCLLRPCYSYRAVSLPNFARPRFLHNRETFAFVPYRN